MIRDYCVTILKELEQDKIYFEDALQVKLSPHTHPLQLWGVGLSSKNEIYLMDGEGDWYKLEKTDVNYELVLYSLYQRLKYMFTKKKAV